MHGTVGTHMHGTAGTHMVVHAWYCMHGTAGMVLHGTAGTHMQDTHRVWGDACHTRGVPVHPPRVLASCRSNCWLLLGPLTQRTLHHLDQINISYKCTVLVSAWLLASKQAIAAHPMAARWLAAAERDSGCVGLPSQGACMWLHASRRANRPR